MEPPAPHEKLGRSWYFGFDLTWSVVPPPGPGSSYVETNFCISRGYHLVSLIYTSTGKVNKLLQHQLLALLDFLCIQLNKITGEPTAEELKVNLRDRSRWSQ